MIDVLTQKATSCPLTGAARARSGDVRLSDRVIGTAGSVTFGTFAPTTLVRWLSAEINGVDNQGCDAVRVRIGTDSKLYYFDESDSLRIKPVTDDDDWDEQASSPLSLASLDLWTEQTLKVQVMLRSTTCNTTPMIRSLTVAMELPVWEGAIAQVSRRIVALVSRMRPVLVHNETIIETKSQWKLGEPYSENGHVLTELVMVTVDGSQRSATLANGTVTISGSPARPGQEVRIAVKYQPQTAVRRVGDVRLINKLPCFLVDDLVRGGGLNGTLPPMNINGVEVRRRMVELRMQIRGVAARQADAFAMRAVMQETFDGSETMSMDSGRTVGAAVMEVVEVAPSGVESMPIAIGTVHCPTTEYTGYRRVTAARRGEAGQYTLATNTVSISNPDAGSAQVGPSDGDQPPEPVQTLDASSYESCGS